MVWQFSRLSTKARHGLEVVAVAGVVDGIAFGTREHAAVLDVLGARQPDLGELALPELDQLGVRHRPQLVALGAEVFEPEARFGRSGTMSGLQFLKFWMRPTCTSGRGRRSSCRERDARLVDDQADRQEVAIAQARRRLRALPGRRRVELRAPAR